MPRKKIIYSSDFPYHVFARANNKEWFYLPKREVWDIFIYEANRIFTSYRTLVHAFVLMDNHYHLMLSTHPDFDLGIVMRDFQKSVSRSINKSADRINHVFGGPYKGSRITSDVHYAEILKYVYRNPVSAGLVKTVQEYEYSSFVSNRLITCSPADGIARQVPKKMESWLNQEDVSSQKEAITKGLSRTIYKPIFSR